ncbi:unnamed protein product [Anisakis simplex]|uniref:UV radiation resistance-associated gene protein (inferred by orthology to a human protein) n=1 Tax=Anisakis simplex TaxID=6269 RepID=A0A0M3K323_ANISI|nr:unnamed protein product [Anisakis simplex]
MSSIESGVERAFDWCMDGLSTASQYFAYCKRVHTIVQVGAVYHRYCYLRLREVCRVLQETQQRVIDQKNELDGLLHTDQQYRDSVCRSAVWNLLIEYLLICNCCSLNVSALQSQKILLRSLEKRIEYARCRIMTISMKLSRVNDDKRIRERDYEKRADEVSEMEKDIEKRTEALSIQRQAISYTVSQLVLRQRKMLNDIMNIYLIDVNGNPQNRLLPLPCICSTAVTIAGHPDTEVSSALGYVVHVLILISQILNIPLKFPVSFAASRSTIMHPLSAAIYPLYSLSKNRDKLEEAIQHLNGNINQLRSDFGLVTNNREKTLNNLHDLLLHLSISDCGIILPNESLIIPSFSVPHVKSAELVFKSMTQRVKRESNNRRVLSLTNHIDIPTKYPK